MGTTAENINPEHITWPDGKDNVAGLRQILYYAPLTDFAVNGLPDVPDDPTGMQGAAKIASSFTFKTGKGWRQMYATRGTGKVDSEMVGERDGKAFKNMVTFFHPGSDEEALGWLRWAKNSNMVFLVIEHDGTRRLIGSEAFPAELESVTGGTGAGEEERKGHEMVVSDVRVSPAPIVADNVTIDLYPAGSGSTQSA